MGLTKLSESAYHKFYSDGSKRIRKFNERDKVMMEWLPECFTTPSVKWYRRKPTSNQSLKFYIIVGSMDVSRFSVQTILSIMDSVMQLTKGVDPKSLNHLRLSCGEYYVFMGSTPIRWETHREKLAEFLINNTKHSDAKLEVELYTVKEV